MTSRLSLALLASVLVLAACGLPGEGTICVYTARSPGQIAAEIPEFITTHPEIRLACPAEDRDVLYCPTRLDDPTDLSRCGDDEPWTVLRQSTTKLTERLIRERARPAADVIWGLAISHLWTLRDDYDGTLRPYAPADLDRVLHRVEAQGSAGTLWQNFLEPELWDQRAYEVPVAVGIDAFAAVFCVNVERMQALHPGWGVGDDAARLSWSDLLADDLAGQVVMPNPTTSGTGFAALVGIYQHFTGIEAHPAGEADAWSFLAALDAAVAVYTTTGDGPCDLVARGDYVVGVTHDAADALPHAGETWEERGVRRVFPAPHPDQNDLRMLGYDIAAGALVEHGAATRTAAQIFLDWALSPPAVRLYAGTTPLVAYELPGTPNPEGYPEDLDASMSGTRLDFNAIARMREDLQARWGAKFCPPDALGLPPARCLATDE